MILRDGTDTREEVKSPGRSVMAWAVVLNDYYMNGDQGDDDYADSDLGEGWAFIGSSKAADDVEAKEWVEAFYADHCGRRRLLSR